MYIRGNYCFLISKLVTIEKGLKSTEHGDKLTRGFPFPGFSNNNNYMIEHGT